MTKITDWQLMCKSLRERGRYMLKHSDFSDCSFLVGKNLVQVFAHKLILVMASPVFMSMFYGPKAAKGPVQLPHLELEPFRCVLEYIYTDDTKLTSVDQATKIKDIANRLMLPHLKKKCTNFIASVQAKLLGN